MVRTSTAPAARGDSAPLAPTPSLPVLFLAFAKIGLTSFGGGLSGWLMRDFVDRRRWIARDEFLNGLALSQALPGINVTNMAIWIGFHLYGWRGALSGVLGILVPPFGIILLLAVAFAAITGYPATHVALAGAAAAAVGLTAQMGIVSALAVRREVLPLAILAGTFIAVALFRLPLFGVVLVAGSFSVAVEYRRVTRARKAAAETAAEPPESGDA